MEILQSNKGGSKLCYKGFIYTRHALCKTKQWWKCTLKSNRGRGSLSTSAVRQSFTRPRQPHNHAPDEASINCTKLRNSMKEKARSSHNAPSQIVAESVSNCADVVKAMLPVENNSKRSIRRYRPQLPTPAHLGELTIPAELTTTLDQDLQPFLLYDNGQDANNRVIAFATEDNLRLLAEADTFFMDGTFDTAPPLFKQMFTIRIAFSTTYITAVYCHLQKKARVGYQELFQAIVDKCEELGLTLNVTKVVSDFEDGLLHVRAINAVFGRQVEHQGCFYHLTQATWRKIQKLRLATHYMEDQDFRLFCNLLFVL